jgi:hypothetical protein
MVKIMKLSTAALVFAAILGTIALNPTKASAAGIDIRLTNQQNRPSLPDRRFVEQRSREQQQRLAEQRAHEQQQRLAEQRAREQQQRLAQQRAREQQQRIAQQRAFELRQRGLRLQQQRYAQTAYRH